jgi:MFS transporter, putative metabolite transport protein
MTDDHQRVSKSVPVLNPAEKKPEACDIVLLSGNQAEKRQEKSVIGAEIQYPRNLVDIIHNDILAAKGAAFIDVLLIVGIFCAVLGADWIGRMRLQIIGFVGCAAGLFLASLSLSTGGTSQIVWLFAGFMLFSLMTNLGPNAMTYLIAGEVFPTHIRGKGAGFAASFAKIGAVTTAFLFPILLADIGTQVLLYILVGTSLLGAVVTWIYGIETKGINLEQIGQERNQELGEMAMNEFKKGTQH